MPEYPWLIYRMSEGPLTVKEVHQGVNEQLNRKLGTDWGYSEYEWANLLQGFRPLPIRTASGTIAHFSDGADSVPMKSIVANIVPIQSGSGTPSPSNPRPISGTDELTLTRTGANVWDEETLDGYYDRNNQGAYVANNNYLCSKNLISVKPSTSYFWCIDFNATFSGRVLYFDKEGNYLSASESNAPKRVFTTPSDCHFIHWYIYKPDTYTYNNDISINYPSTDTSYHAYTGSTYTIDLAQEIMGGTADVVGGVGTNAFSNLDLSSLEWTYSSTYQRFSTTSQVAGIKTPPNNNTVANILCSHFNSDTSNNTAEVGKDNIIGVSMTGVIQIRDTSLNGDISALMTLLENVDFVYELATPTDFTFTGQPIRSYLGTNNVWTDSGEVLDVEYRANF